MKTYTLTLESEDCQYVMGILRGNLALSDCDDLRKIMTNMYKQIAEQDIASQKEQVEGKCQD